MSYILDALKKAERERDLGHIPRIDTLHEAPAARARPWKWLIVAALLVNAAVIVLALRPETPESSVAAAPDMPRQVPEPVAAGAALAQPPVAQAAPMAEPPALETAPVSAPSVPAQEVVATADASEPVRREGLVSALPPPAPVETARAHSAAVETEAVPLLRDTPSAFRRSVPDLKLDVHVYAEERDQRFVLINLRRYREGEQLAEGPTLERITPDGVILGQSGQRFRLTRP